MKLAAIDLGSNTAKLTIADVHSATEIVPIVERADFTRIGEGLETQPYLQPQAIERTLNVLAEYADEARRAGAVRIACVATAGLRGATNAPAFIDRVQADTGIRIEVIDGLREAALAYRAPAAAFGPGPLIVVDVGGRSTEIISGRGATIIDRASLEIGGVRLTERFLASDPPSDEQRQALGAHLTGSLRAAPPKIQGAVLVGVSGTALSLMGVHRGDTDIRHTVRYAEGGWLPTTAIRTILDDLARVPASERLRGSVIPNGRADVIVAGASILLAVCQHYDVEGLRVTHRGVRFGLLYEMIDRATLTE